MASSTHSETGGRGPDDDALEIPTLGDVWPDVPGESAPELSPRSMAPRNFGTKQDKRRTVLNSIEPSRPPVRATDHVLSRAARYARAQEERYADEPAPPRAAVTSPEPNVTNERAQKSRGPVVPEELQARYVRQGQNWYTTNGKLAFSVRSERFTTRRDDRDIARDLVLAAERNGWSEVTVTGTERWRRRAWREATLAGLQVKGYDPTPREQKQVVRDIARQSALLAGAQAPESERSQDRGDQSKSPQPSLDTGLGKPERRARSSGSEREPPTREAKRRRMDIETMEGKLIKHGQAPFLFKSDESPSYFATILTADGKRTFWGVGLKDAIEKSETMIQTGDRVALRRVGKTPVTVTLEERTADGKTQQVKIDTERVEWRVERPEWFVNRTQQARMMRDDQLAARRAAAQDPELARAMMSLRAGELLAEERLSDPKQREQFIGEVARRLEREMAKGRAAPNPKVRARASARANGRPLEVDPRVRDEERSR